MVKKISLILILLLIAFPAAFAAVDVDLVGGIGGSVISMGFGTLGGNTGGDFQMAFDVSAETDVLFNANHGLYAGLGLSATAARNGSASLMIFTGYMFRTPVKDFDLVVGVGPHVSGIGSDEGRFGVSSSVNLDYYMTERVFLRGGAGIRMDFLRFGGRTSNGMFWVTLTGPFFCPWSCRLLFSVDDTSESLYPFIASRTRPWLNRKAVSSTDNWFLNTVSLICNRVTTFCNI